MKNANWTRILTILLVLLATYALLAIAVAIIQRFIAPLLLLVLAAILAYILTPAVDRIHKAQHGPRPLAILTTYVLLAVILFGLGVLLTQPLIAQTRSLVDAMKNPSHVQTVQTVSQSADAIAGRAQSYELAINSGACSQAAILIGAHPGPGLCPTSVSQGTPTLPQQLNKLQYRLLPLLLQPRSIRSTSKPLPGTNSRVHANPVPSTQVPPSYVAPLVKDIGRLRSSIRTSQRDFQASRMPLTVGASRKLLQLARRLQTDARHLYTTVKSTPVLMLALQVRLDQHHINVNVRSLFGQAVNKVSGQSANVLNNAVAILTGTINVIFNLILVLVMSFYLLADGGRFIGWIMGIVPDRNREQVWFFIKSLDTVLGGYIRGQLIVAVMIGMLAGLGSQIIGVPYALLIGVFAFLAESIPVIGPVLASIPAILISLFTLSIVQTLIVAGWFVVIQQIEQNLVGPRITGHAVGIHPVVAMIAILAGFEIGGFWGAFLAIPIAGVLHVLAREAYNYVVLQRPLPTATVPDTVDLPDEPSDRHSTPAAE